ncbi:MAG: cation transporter [Ignavibacteria bacterium]|nr:cation transporter [Ignavibacteria bacterium]
MACTASIFVAQVVGGFFSHSLSLLSDAGHMFADAGALFIAYMALRFYSRSHGNVEKLRKYTFGFRRIEVLAALVNGVVLLGMCGYIMIEAIERFFHPEEILSVQMLFVATIGLIANGISAMVLHKSHHLSTRSAYLHVLTDLLSSVAVIIGGIMIYLTNYYWIDSILSFLIASMIIRSAIRLIRTSGVVLMDSAPMTIPKQDIERELLVIEGVASVHDVHVWEISPGENTMSAHIVVPSEEHHDHILHLMKTMLAEKFSLHHSTLQIESQLYSDEQGCDGCSLHEKNETTDK